MSDIDFGEQLPDGFSCTSTPALGGGYVHRTGQILAEPEAVDLVTQRLEARGRNVDDSQSLGGTGLVLLETDEQDVPALIDDVRTVGHEPVPAAWPNHVFHHLSHMRFFTRLPPSPADPPEPTQGTVGEGMTVAVIDSGVWDHPWFAGRVSFTGDDLEEPDENGNDELDLAAGHGTFVAGLILQHAPGASVSVRRIPDRLAAGQGRTGLVDDVTLAAMFDDVGTEVDVVNVSLGGWTAGDLAPPMTAAAITRLRARNPGCAIVAAAGNVPVDRPSWPAALKGVIAVGALQAQQQAWSESGRGWWVDAWAHGVDARSTFHEWSGEMEHPDGAPGTFAGGAVWTGTSFAAPRIAGTIAAKASGPGLARRMAARLLEESPSLGGQAGVVVATSSGP
jgi:hypothetical protein